MENIALSMYEIISLGRRTRLVYFVLPSALIQRISVKHYYIQIFLKTYLKQNGYNTMELSVETRNKFITNDHEIKVSGEIALNLSLIHI